MVVLLLGLAALAGIIALATRGYRVLAAEQLAATLRTEPLPNKHFHATIVLPGQPVAMYDLAGDLFSIDAHILRWHPIVSIWGLGTAYKLNRVTGRKQEVAYSLAPPEGLDMFRLVKAFPLTGAAGGRRRAVGERHRRGAAGQLRCAGFRYRPGDSTSRTVSAAGRAGHFTGVWNCAFSVEPSIASVAEVPFVATCVTSSK